MPAIGEAAQVVLQIIKTRQLDRIAYDARFADQKPHDVRTWGELPEAAKAVWANVAVNVVTAWVTARPAPVSPATPITDAQGIEWFERTFGVPLGDMPGRLEVEAVRARAGVPSLDELGGAQ